MVVDALGFPTLSFQGVIPMFEWGRRGVVMAIAARRSHVWLVTGVAMVAIGFLFGVIATAPASAAAYKQFCWGVNVAGGESVESTCNSLSHDGIGGYIDVIGGSGEQHSVCVHVWGKEGTNKCSSGPNQGVYNFTPEGKISSVGQIDNNAAGSNTVYAFITTCNSVCGGGSGEGGGSSPPPSSPLRVAYADAADANTVTGWDFTGAGGWTQVPLWGHQIAEGTSPETLTANGVKHIFYVDAGNSNTITDWKWSPTSGWQQEPLYGHSVASGSSPTATVDGSGNPRVYFVDANNSNSITEWKWTSATGWQQSFLYGHPVAKGTSPVVASFGGAPHVYFVDASNNNTISEWGWNSVLGWGQT